MDWLVNLHKKHLNGILADETGLGKTVQTVAYMAQLAGQEGMPLLYMIFLTVNIVFNLFLINCYYASERHKDVVIFFVHRHLGTPPYSSKDVQVAKLGGGVQALVSWP